ncbi:hypothetical protein G6O69_12275 [Pseudenhygromyxa sp. WMMC2535]|uniref:hypothetical protein n=1 Tax=Pseudenhygromyxa sp. WMMC2535 TaxID=2712867 RepID=UPI0015520D17|nr:hypothetical protein [Pseudenhygromyxa sp. WMMC2535]NVB38608.1 hypothetical protein [Pseudenhygromyxa sp. WMMC2535]
MPDADIHAILAELDDAYVELRAARKRLTELLPLSATEPGESGQRRIDFVTDLDADTEEEDELRRINAEAWQHAQQALVRAQEKVETAHKELAVRVREDS